MKPNIISCELNDDGTVSYLIQIEPEQFWLQGHFPIQPVLPGVAQIHWVVELALNHFSLNARFKGLDRLKFQNPILPGQFVRLTLNWNQTSEILSFLYEIMAEVENEFSKKQIERVYTSASSGRISLCSA